MVAMFLAFQPAAAQEYPSKPVTVIVPFSTGSASDVIARIVLERMSANVGQRFIVDNRPAAGGALGTAAGAKAGAHRHNLPIGASGPLGVGEAPPPGLPYPSERDLQPIS